MGLFLEFEFVSQTLFPHQESRTKNDRELDGDRMTRVGVCGEIPEVLLGKSVGFE
jgi:hypothetical protein